MDLNNNTPIIRCYVTTSPLYGLGDVEVLQKYDAFTDPPEGCSKHYINLPSEFIATYIEPIYEYVASYYSPDKAQQLVLVILTMGIQQAMSKYEKLLEHKQSDTLQDFRPEILIYNNEGMEDLLTVYQHLLTVFDQHLVQTFIFDLALYGFCVVENIPETDLYGPIGFAQAN